MKKIIILNGPNLNLLGEREKNQYGNFTLKNIEENCNNYASKNNINLSLFQSNIEGELVEKIQNARNNQDGLIVNAGGYTHTSVALRDCISAVDTPVIEVHLSNIASRESFRHDSIITPVCKGCIMGFGLESYELAMYYFLNRQM